MIKGSDKFAISAVEQVYQNASNLHISLIRRVKDIKATWTIYHQQGLLPETNVFDCIIQEIKSCFKRVIQQSHEITSLLKETINQTDYSESLKKNVFELFPIDRQKEIRRSVKAIKLDIFDNFEIFAESLTYLLQHLNSRIGTLGHNDPNYGLDLNLHRYTDIQAVYDAAESIIWDYMSSFGDKTYNGLLTFGYNYKAKAYTTNLYSFPLYAEQPIHFPMLVILAHEAGHRLQGNPLQGNSCPPLTQFRKRIRKRIEKIEVINKRNNCFSFISLLGPIAEDFQIRFRPEDSKRRQLAGEITADIFATIIAGPAYPRILSYYCLPLYLDTITTGDINDMSILKKNITWAFYFSSLKLRISIEIALKMEYINKSEYTYLKQYITWNEAVQTDIAQFYSREIPQNEMLRMALNYCSNSNERITNTYELLAKAKISLDNFVDQIINGIPSEVEETKPILDIFFDECLGKNGDNLITMKSFCHSNDEQSLRNDFKGAVSYAEILDFWKDHESCRPRHLLSIMVPELNDVYKGSPANNGKSNNILNSYAIILALSHHQSIINRYQQIQT